MRLHSFLLVSLVAVGLGGSAAAQENQTVEPELPDPTQVSPAIESQLGAVRGVEQLNQLKAQLEQVVRQNQQLSERLEAVRQDNQLLQTKLEAALSREEQVQARKQAIPTMRLVAQLRT